MNEDYPNSNNQNGIQEKTNKDNLHLTKTEDTLEEKKKEKSEEEDANVYRSDDIMDDRNLAQNIVQNKVGATPKLNVKKSIKDQEIESNIVNETIENLEEDDDYDENNFDMSNFQDKELIFYLQ